MVVKAMEKERMMRTRTMMMKEKTMTTKMKTMKTILEKEMTMKERTKKEKVVNQEALVRNQLLKCQRASLKINNNSSNDDSPVNESSVEVEVKSSNEEDSDEDNSNKKENNVVIKNAQERLNNYISAIEYCQKHNLNSNGIDSLIQKKKSIEEKIKEMKKSKDAKGISIYLPNEISPETLFGKTSAETNKEKADLLSSVNKSINDHQNLQQSLKESQYKKKDDFKQNQKKITENLDHQKEMKEQLEIIQKNRWWPTPEHIKRKVTYSVPKGAENIKEDEGEGEPIQCIVQIKKQPTTDTQDFKLYCLSTSGFNETRTIPLKSKVVVEKFKIPIKDIEDLKNYQVCLSKSIKKKSCMCFGTSEVEIVNMVIQLRSLARNEEKTSNFRKGEYDIMLSVKFEGDELKLKQNAEIDFANLNPNEKQLNFDVIEILCEILNIINNSK